MAHEIYENSMMYVGVRPWHGLGRQLPMNATYDEVVEAAKFYDVVKRELYMPGTLSPVPDRRALVRGDDGSYLATVGDGYEVVQAREVSRTLVEAANGVGAIFHTAGLLGPNGIRFWMLAELPEPIRVRGDKSEIRKYLLGTSAHDGASAVLIQNVATRVVCANTLGTALGEQSEGRWSIKHTRSAKHRLDEAAQGFKALVRGYDRFGELANLMASTRFTERQLRKTLEAVMPIPHDDAGHHRLLTNREKVIELFEVGTGIDGGIRGTAWAAFQAHTEFADHHRTLRGVAKSDERAARLESSWLGAGAAMKRKALDAIANEVGIAA